jgi:arylsulfatase
MTTDQPTKRPNIVFVMADDMGYSDLGCYGGEVHTPNIDRLAERGLRYTQMYNSARCCPSRAALLTGLHPHQAGIGWMDFGGISTPDAPGEFRGWLERNGRYQGWLDPASCTIAEVLGPAGYRTMLSGKWHVAGNVEPGDVELFDPTRPEPPITPLQRGFDEFWGLLNGAASYYQPHLLMDGNELLEVDDPGFYLTDAISDHAVDMASRAIDDEVPFFLFVAYTAPHWPLQALEEDVARYERTFRAGWDVIRAERHERLRDSGILDPRWEISSRDPDSFAFADARFAEWEAHRMAVYAAQIDRMDQGVGRIVEALERQGVLDDTIIMVCSDNGGCSEFMAEEPLGDDLASYGGTTLDGRPIRVGNSPELRPGGPETFMSYDLPWANASNSPFRRYKSWVHEGGISTPFVVHWPRGIAAGGVRRAPVHFIDVLPTLAELGGATIPTDRDGLDLPPFEGESFTATFGSDDWRRCRPLWFEHEGNRALRDETWKLVSRHPDSWELYNMEDDRTETTNLAEREGARLRRMIELWEDRAFSVGVRGDLGWLWDGVRTFHTEGLSGLHSKFMRS